MLALLAVLSIAPLATAQNSNPITQSMVTEATVSASTREAVGTFCDTAAQAMTSQDITAITNARRTHLENFRRAQASGASQSFADFYEQQVASSFAGVLTDASELGQINMMLALQGRRSEASLGVMIAALGEGPAAVQYLAAQGLLKAYSSNAANTISPDVSRQAIAALRTALPDSGGDAPVVQAVLTAMSAIPDGFSPAVSELNARITALQPNALTDISGEANALVGMVAQAERMTQGNTTSLQNHSRETMAAAFRLARVTQARLAALPAQSPQITPLADSLKLIEREVLRPGALQAFNVGSLPPSIESPVNERQWPAVADALTRWRTLLTQAPINIRENQLAGQ